MRGRLFFAGPIQRLLIYFKRLPRHAFRREILRRVFLRGRGYAPGERFIRKQAAYRPCERGGVARLDKHS
jgi:hypothetical protein